jgi:2-methylcitrate dehydratase PrpD
VLTQSGVTGAQQVLEGTRGMLAGMSRDGNPAKIAADLGTRWATLEMSFKWHASCRHTHPAADALQRVMADNGLAAADIAGVVAHVHQGAIDVLGAVTRPKTVHQSKFCMGSVLGLVAVHGCADLERFDRAALTDPEVTGFLDKVVMSLDEEVDRAYPKKWIGKVSVDTRDGRRLHGRVDDPKGDPENPLTPAELKAKAVRLAEYQGAATPEQMARWISRVETLEAEPRLDAFFAQPR